MRTLLDRIAELAFEQLGERPDVAGPPDPSGIPDMPGRVVPAEVRDLYSITGGARHPSVTPSSSWPLSSPSTWPSSTGAPVA